jgi:hypothetical protein
VSQELKVLKKHMHENDQLILYFESTTKENNFECEYLKKRMNIYEVETL